LFFEIVEGTERLTDPLSVDMWLNILLAEEGKAFNQVDEPQDYQMIGLN
jgi:hypothetical protein